MLQKYIFTLAGLMAFYQYAEIQANYTPHQVELQNTIKNYAKSINDKGTIAGQLETLDSTTGEKLVVDYFWNLDQPEPVVITTEGHAGHPPLINNHGEVVGIIKKRDTSWWEGDEWWQKDVREVYLYNPNEGLNLLGKPDVGSRDLTVFSFSDAGQIDLAVEGQQTRIMKPKGSYTWPRASPVGSVPVSNRKGNWLLSVNSESFLGNEYYLEVYNFYSAADFLMIFRDSKIQGVAINDKNQIIATNGDGTEGFFWPDPKAEEPKICIELGDFIPVALNNNGDIVGKKEGSFFLRKADASMIDLSALDQKLEEVTGISDDGHIIGITKVDGQDKVIFLEPRNE